MIDAAQLDAWIVSAATTPEPAAFASFRTSVQDALVEALVRQGISGVSIDENVAYASMLLLSGRATPEELRDAPPAASPPGFRLAVGLYEHLVPAALPAGAMLARTLEVANAFFARSVDDARRIAEDGLRLWPDSAELRRQCGVIALAQQRYGDACRDFEAARALRPDIVPVDEPYALARALMLPQSERITAELAGPFEAFNRTPLHVFVLDVTTFGFYTVYWLIRNYRLAELRLGREPTPYWHWLGLLIPLWNLVPLYGGVSFIGKRVEASGVRYPVPFAVQMVFLHVTSLLWRLPGPWWLLSLASSVFLATMHVSLAAAERRDNTVQRGPGFTKWEVAITLAGSALLALAAYVSFLPDTSTP